MVALASTDLLEMLMLRLFHVVRLLRVERFLLGGKAYPFLEYFRGFQNVSAARRIFGDRTEEVLSKLKIRFTWVGGYMWVDGREGSLMISSRYLKNGDRVDVYLDLLHELVHVRQLMEGRELFDDRYRYSERPTEVEAYRYAVEEARRLGLSDRRICEYLKTEWMTEQDLRELAMAVDVGC